MGKRSFALSSVAFRDAVQGNVIVLMYLERLTVAGTPSEIHPT